MAAEPLQRMRFEDDIKFPPYPSVLYKWIVARDEARRLS